MSGTDNILRRSFLREIQVVVLFVFIVSFFIADIALAAEQQVLFCAESIRYAKDTGKSDCEKICERHTNCGIDSLLSKGWLIVSSSSKEMVGYDWKYIPYVKMHKFEQPAMDLGCSCIGTQYVLRKEDKSTTTNPTISGKESDLLKKENELLKRENEILKRENESLKGKLKAKQK